MFTRESPKSDVRNSDEPHRSLSRTTMSTSDAVDCLINVNDLAFENEFLTQETKQNRRSENYRGETSRSKRSYDNSSHRSQRAQSPSTSRKYPSSRSPGPSSRSHQHQSYHSSQRSRAALSPSPTEGSTSRYSSSSSRSNTAKKRHHSPSDSSYERRTQQKTVSSRSSKDKSDQIASGSNSSSESQSKTKKADKTPSENYTADLSVISEDESTKVNEHRNDRVSFGQDHPSTSVMSNQLHSTPSTTTNYTNAKENIPDVSLNGQDLEISLVANSLLGTSNNLSTMTPSTSSQQSLLTTIELIKSYENLISSPSNNSLINNFRREIQTIIERNIELEKRSLDIREQSLRLQQIEIMGQEKRVQKQLSVPGITSDVVNQIVVNVNESVQQEQSNQNASLTDVKSALEIHNKAEIPTTQTSIEPNESVKSVLTEETPGPKEAKQESSTVFRRNVGQSRFSRAKVDSSMFTRTNKSMNLYGEDELEQNKLPNETVEPVDSVNNSRVSTSAETNLSRIHTDLKVTSSNSFRKVQIQHGARDESPKSKTSQEDLRSTLMNIRLISSNPENNENSADKVQDEKQNIVDIVPDSMTSNQTVTIKSYSERESKEDSFDYRSQRNVTAPNEIDTDDNNYEKRSNRQNHPQYRQYNSRPQQRDHHYQGTNQSSSKNNFHDYSYTDRYRQKSKHHEKEDLRSQLNNNQHSKSSRPVHRNT